MVVRKKKGAFEPYMSDFAMTQADIERKQMTGSHIEKNTVLNHTDTDPIELLAKLRLSSLSLPAMLALSIVDSNNHGKYPMVYIGEVEGMFLSYYKPGGKPWGYSAIGQLLNRLAKRGYLNKERHGRYVAYGMTDKGIRAVAEIDINLLSKKQ